jgi:hypothetical protein
MRKAIILQAFGIGDVIFAMGVAEHFIKQGYSVIWPVKPMFVEGLQIAYPNVCFDSDENYSPELFNIKEDKLVDGARIIPIRWSDRLVGKESKWWMRTKYDLYGLDYTLWKKYAVYERNHNKEKELFYSVFGLMDGEKFNLINRSFRSNFTGSINIEPNNEIRNVEISVRAGYSLFDYSLLIERATNIHVVNSAIFYLLELLELRAESVHIYSRIPDEVGFPYVDYLMTKKYILH